MKRWRTPLAGLLTLIWLAFYISIIVSIGTSISHWSPWILAGLFMVAGLVWVFPCYFLYRWSSKDPGNEISNKEAETLFKP